MADVHCKGLILALMTERMRQISISLLCFAAASSLLVTGVFEHYSDAAKNGSTVFLPLQLIYDM